MRALQEPLSDHTSNPNRDDYWTCCACYTDLYNIGEGTHTCPACGHVLECSIEMEPACHARLVERDHA
ncbi:hypothetical protein [Oceaniglobus trochenteri]|uniref:hypothetical protein n=1 Tax=Oceaniglobus trochenteri TaxID=2763260 RepID=UPI001CFF7A49|nr:hypothetical protein [Oceaniglobus trochenteri]